LEVQREIKYFIIIVRLSKQEVILDQSQFVDVMKYICGIEIIVNNKRMDCGIEFANNRLKEVLKF